MDPTSDTPTAVTKAITDHGGRNPYGRPMWRLIRAELHLSKKRGVWHTFPDGTLEQVVRDEQGRFLHNPLHALRVEYGVRETPMYPFKGWILERWLPAETWGSREEWNADWGPYPEAGDYFIMSTALDQMPPTEYLREQISKWERDWETRPRTLEKAYRLFMQEEREQQQKEQEHIEAELAGFYRGEIKPIFNTVSLGAQKVRNEVQASIGRDSHLGAGQ